MNKEKYAKYFTSQKSEKWIVVKIEFEDHYILFWTINSNRILDDNNVLLTCEDVSRDRSVQNVHLTYPTCFHTSEYAGKYVAVWQRHKAFRINLKISNWNRNGKELKLRQVEDSFRNGISFANWTYLCYFLKIKCNIFRTDIIWMKTLKNKMLLHNLQKSVSKIWTCGQW